MKKVVRCSKLARYMVCAGYMHLDLPEEAEGGAPAKEGTAAGEWLQGLLEKQPLGMVAQNGVYFDEDMKFFTAPLAENILERAQGPVSCEKRIDWETASGFVIRGQPDASYEMDNGETLCVDDLKYGWGIVEVTENWQLLGYAIGEVIKRGKYYHKIRLRVLQPRPHHEDGTIREWVLSYAQLLEYKDKIEARMTLLATGHNELTTSKMCKYCPGTAECCPAFSRLFYRALDVSVAFVQDSLTNEEISRQLDQAKRAKEAIEIKLDSLTELGTHRIKAGGIIPGYVQTNKYGHRSWKQGITPEAIKLMTGKDVIEKSFMSPAKAEKLGISKKLVEQLTTAPLVAVKLEKKDSSAVGNKIFGNTNPLGGVTT